MNEQELERLVVRLVGDVTGYVEGMRRAQEEARRTAAEAQRSILDVEAFNRRLNIIGNSLQEVGGQITAAFGAFGAASLHAWEEAEDIGIRLTATLEANGRAVTETRKDYEEFAATLQKTTRAEGDAVLGLLAVAESMQLTGDAAKKAVEDAIALSKIGGVGRESALRITGALATGDVEKAMMSGRYIMALRGVKDETEFLARANALVSAGMKAVNDDVNTGAGRMEQLSNEWGDFQEQLGQVMSEGLIPIAETMKEVVSFMQGMDQTTLKVIAGTIGLGVALGTLATTMGTAILVWNTLIKTAVDYTKAAAASTAGTIALRAAVAAFAAYAVVQFANWATGTSAQIRQVTSDIEQMRSSFQEGRSTLRENFAKDLEGIKLAGPERKAELEKQAKDLEDNIRRQQEVLEELRKTREGQDTTLGGATRFLGFSAETEREWQTINELIREQEQHLRDLNAQNSTLQQHLKNQGAISKSLSDDWDKFNNSLKLQVDTFGMTSEEVKLYEFSLKAAGNAQDKLAESRKLIDQLKKLKDEAAGVEQVFKDIDDIMAAGERTTEQFMTPLEQFNKTMADLNDQLHVGAITQEVYAKAVEAANQKLYETENAAGAASAAVQQLDAVLSGSAAAERMLRAQGQAIGIQTFSSFGVNTGGTATSDSLLVSINRSIDALGQNALVIMEAGF